MSGFPSGAAKSPLKPTARLPLKRKVETCANHLKLKKDIHRLQLPILSNFQVRTCWFQGTLR